MTQTRQRPGGPNPEAPNNSRTPRHPDNSPPPGGMPRPTRPWCRDLSLAIDVAIDLAERNPPEHTRRVVRRLRTNAERAAMDAGPVTGIDVAAAGLRRVARRVPT